MEIHADDHIVDGAAEQTAVDGDVRQVADDDLRPPVRRRPDLLLPLLLEPFFEDEFDVERVRVGRGHHRHGHLLRGPQPLGIHGRDLDDHLALGHRLEHQFAPLHPGGRDAPGACRHLVRQHVPVRIGKASCDHHPDRGPTDLQPIGVRRTSAASLTVLPAGRSNAARDSVPRCTDTGNRRAAGKPPGARTTTCAGPGASTSGVSERSSSSATGNGAPGLESR